MIFLYYLFFFSSIALSQEVTHVPTIEIFPGEVRFFSFDIPMVYSKPTLICKNQEMIYFTQNNQGFAYLSESYFSDLKPYSCKLKDIKMGAQRKVLKVEVKEKKYEVEKLSVGRKKLYPSFKNELRIAKERKLLKKIYAQNILEPLFKTSFKWPITSAITSHYGKRRIFNHKKKSQHLGTDFKAAIGTAVYATAEGKVVFIKDLFHSGKTIILSHGMGIYSIYAHLSKTKIKKGQRVKQGELIALSGKTGRVSGPHLHFGVKVQGHWIDGQSLMEESERQFPSERDKEIVFHDR